MHKVKYHIFFYDVSTPKLLLKYLYLWGNMFNVQSIVIYINCWFGSARGIYMISPTLFEFSQVMRLIPLSFLEVSVFLSATDSHLLASFYPLHIV